MNSFLHVSISHSSKASSKASIWNSLFEASLKPTRHNPQQPLTPFKWSERFKVNPSLFKPWNCSRPSNDVFDKDVFDNLQPNTLQIVLESP